jgi:Protein of unknown function (DUF3489)
VSKSAKKRTLAAASAIAARTSAQQSQNERKPKQGCVAAQQSHVIAMLRSPVPRIDAMMKATGWQQHSVRGFLAGVVRKRLNLKLSSDKVSGKRIYQIKSSNGGKPTVRAAQQLPA